jgi:hypothetical protein
MPKSTLTRDELEAGYDNPDWLGHGYLHVRAENMAKAAGRAIADEADGMILDYANAQGWSKKDLFNWANSKTVRWFGETWWHGSGKADRHLASLMVKVAA